MSWETVVSVLSVVAAVTGLTVKYIAPLQAAKLNNEAGKNLKSFIETAVTAAGQMYPKPGEGKSKLAYVYELLAAEGVQFDAGEKVTAVRALIEAAVFAVKGGINHGNQG